MFRYWFGISFLALCISCAGAPCHAQQSQEPSQQQPPAGSSSTQKQSQSNPDPSDVHKYDAYNAEKDIDVGNFYLHKGDIDAAIPRFEEAAALQPKAGKPRLLLAECYEKKHDPANAAKYYREYLKVYPNAPDAKKIQKKIEKLEAQ